MKRISLSDIKHSAGKKTNYIREYKLHGYKKSYLRTNNLYFFAQTQGSSIATCDIILHYSNEFFSYFSWIFSNGPKN